ncbi:hypothetical protein OC861_005469 [Tilletia horrida]|nr:hypothetical protein OC861_005469 [Tilletia horrida]
MMQRSSALTLRHAAASSIATRASLTAATASAFGSATRLAAAASSSRSTPAAAAAPSLFRLSSARPSFLRYSSTSAPATASASAEEPAAEADIDLPEPHGPAQFSSLKGKVSAPTLKALVSEPFNFKAMSVVQDRVLTRLPDLIDPTKPAFEDLLVKAKTGTGKTIAFLVPAVEARVRAIQAIKEGTYGYLKPWEQLLQANRPEFFEGKPNGQPLDYTSIDKAQRSKLAGLFRKHTAGTLILSPTRELATQIATEARKLYTHHRSSGSSGSRSRGSPQSFGPDPVHLLVGGVSRGLQKRKLLDGTPDVIVGTPGRILDFLADDAFVKSALATCQTFILDEADTLLDMGFREDIKKITEALPNAKVITRNSRSGRDAEVEADEESGVKPLTRQTFLFSATASKEIQSVASWALGDQNDYINCVPDGEDQTHAHIPQKAYIMSSGPEQFRQVVRLIQHDQLIHPGKSKVIVFAPTTLLVQYISNYLRTVARQGGFPANTKDIYGGADERPGSGGAVYELHSKMDQDRRFRRSARFRSDASGGAILVTSDVSARGVDYPGTTRVIQFGVTNSRDNYIHRIGRTGRAQHQGGRADMVLQEWEASYVQGALGKLPVQIGIADEVEKEVKELAAGFDAQGFAGLKLDEDKLKDVSKAFAPAKKGYPRDRRGSGGRFGDRGGSGPPSAPAQWQAPILPKLENEELFAKTHDREDVREVMMSLIGFYSPILTSDMRNSAMDRVRGLQRWTEQLTGEEGAGYVSPSFLTKMGISDRGGFSSRSGSRRGGGGRRGGEFGGSRGGYGSRDGREEGGMWADLNSEGRGQGSGSRSASFQRRGDSRDFGGGRSSGAHRFNDRRDKNDSYRQGSSFSRGGDRDRDGSRGGRRQFGDEGFSRPRSSYYDQDSF